MLGTFATGQTYLPGSVSASLRTQYQYGTSSIQQTISRDIEGTSFVEQQYFLEQLGVSYIHATASRMQTGLSAVQQIATRDQIGEAYLYTRTIQTQSGVGNIFTHTGRPQYGVARIADKPVFNGKTFEYKVYSKSGSYIGTLDRVTSEFTYPQEINSAGSQVVITVGRPADDFGEGTIINFNNEIKVYVYDQDEPSGKLIFDGFVSNYTPSFVHEGDSVAVTVLGYGTELDDYVIEGGETLEIEQLTATTTTLFGNSASMTSTRRIGQSFTAATNYKLRSIVVRLRLSDLYSSSPPIGTTLRFYHGEPTSMTNVATVVGASVTSTTPLNYTYTFNEDIQLTISEVYTFFIETTTPIYPGSDNYPLQASCTDVSVYAGGKLWYTYNDSSELFDSTATSDLYFKVYKGGGSTTAPYLTVDPSNVLKSILDDYNAKGGRITYTNDTIDATGTSVSYTFNTNTTFEGINKCLELAPEGWYYYIDQATNLLHFHKRVDIPDYLFLLDKHIETLHITKSIESIVNIVLFTGGGNPPMYRRYVRQGSINEYGPKVYRMQDQRVTVDATAATMANSILNARSAPQLSTVLVIIDNAIDNKIGFDLESIVLGKMLTIAGPGLSGDGSSAWDRMSWDIDYWDYNISQLSTVVMQITKLNYNGDKVTLDLSTVPPDVNKRIEDINRNLQALMTVANPDSPVEG